MKSKIPFFFAGVAFSLILALAVPPAARNQEKVDWQRVSDDYRKALSAWEEYVKLSKPGSKKVREARARIEDLKARLPPTGISKP